jgi:hypothetical protein
VPDQHKYCIVRNLDLVAVEYIRHDSWKNEQWHWEELDGGRKQGAQLCVTNCGCTEYSLDDCLVGAPVPDSEHCAKRAEVSGQSCRRMGARTAATASGHKAA